MIYDCAVEEGRIARLLEPYISLDSALLSNISIYIDLLLKWNTRINLTAIRDPEEMVTRHFGESFFAAAKLIERSWSGSIIDLGSGAGFPGLPMAMYAPTAQVTLIESQAKKASFLNEAIRSLQLRNVRVYSGRAEQFPDKAELVAMRAVEKFEKSLPVAAALVKQAGRLALLVGIDQSSAAKTNLQGFEWQDPIRVPEAASRVIVVGTRIVKVEQNT